MALIAVRAVVLLFNSICQVVPMTIIGVMPHTKFGQNLLKIEAIIKNKKSKQRQTDKDNLGSMHKIFYCIKDNT